MDLLTPKMRFRLQRWRNRLGAWRASAERTQQAVMAEQKMCPNCRALVGRDQKECPYCGQRLAVFSHTPAGRLIGRVTPSGGGIPITGYLLLANFVMFALEYALSGTSILQGLMSEPSQRVMLRLGESLPLGYVLVAHQEWRWVTAMYLHANLLHIGFNMWALFDLGPVVESFYGGAKFLTFYMVTGAFGYMVSGYAGNASLGASGALFGLLGILIAYGTRRSHTAAGRQLRGMAVRWAIYALVLAFVIPNVDNYAHIGGLVCGLAMGFMVGDDPPLTPAQVRLWTTVQWIVVLVTVGCFVLMARSPIRLG